VRALLLCLIAASALANWWSRLPDRGPTAARVETVSKPLTTLLVIAVALTSGAPTDQVTIAAIALGLCLVGDVALMDPFDRFIVGLGAFLLGHVVFVVLFATFGLHHPTLAGIAVLAGAILASTVGRTILVAARAHDATLTVPVAAYLVVILLTAAVGWATGRPAVLVGTALFVVSDSILGWQTFVRPHRWSPLAIMVTYHVAITALALAL
jgi:uncharacterized membrane protein YhhN